jgi:hypothetical protein
LLTLTPPGSGPFNNGFYFDPRNPTPAFGGPRFNPADGDLKIGPFDESDTVNSRADVLNYGSSLMTSPLSIAGKIKAILYVSSDRTDCDFVLRLCCRYPGGEAMIMNYTARRMRFRNSYDAESLMVPWTVYRVELEFDPIALTIPTGYALAINLSSAAFPYVDINLNNGGPMYVAGDTLIAMNTVYRSAEHPSMIIVPIARASTGILEHAAKLPEAITISAYPNPFNSAVRISVSPSSGSSSHLLPRQGEGINVEIYDVAGKLIPLNPPLTRGTFKTPGVGERSEAGGLIWSPAPEVPSGIYLVKVKTGNSETTQKVVYLK